MTDSSNSPEVTRFLLALERTLRQPDFAAPYKIEFESHVTANLFCRMRGSNAFGLLKFTDFYFFYDWDSLPAPEQPRTLHELHESNRAFANTEFRVPKLLRMHVPNVVSVAVSARDFPPEMIELVQQRTFLPGGGEAHQMQAVQVARGELYFQPENRVRNMTYEEIDPINRARGFMRKAVRAALLEGR